MRSECFASEFVLNADNGNKSLVYSYMSTPRLTVRDRSSMHHGTALLEIRNTPTKELCGEYWTDRRSTGEIELTLRESRLLDAFPKELLSNTDPKAKTKRARHRVSKKTP